MEFSTLLLSILTCLCLYYFFRNKYSKFTRLMIPHVSAIPLLGNMAPYVFGRMSFVEIIQKAYNLFPNAKYIGFYDFMKPVYIIRDPDLMASIAIKNFDNFCDHNNFVNEDLDPMASRNLFGLKGDYWREIRRVLSPTFTSSKLKLMFKLMCECGENLVSFLEEESKNGKVYDMKELLCKYSNDVVATCAFGIGVDSFKNPKNEFYVLGREALNFGVKKSFVFTMNRHLPNIMKLFRIRMFGDKVDRFFKQVVSETVKMREEQGIIRPDMIHIMMETRNKNEKVTFDIDEMTSQAFVFFLGGFDSVSTAMCFLTYELAVNPDVQSKLRAEVEDILKKNGDKPTYDAINSMKYMDAVVNECLRLYPLGAYIDKKCVKDFELPPALPDSKPIWIKAGDDVWLPGYSVHRDPKYFRDPNKFNPDRFLNGEVDNSVYIPFGLGPRICIGNRFAIMEIKIMLFYLLWRCVLEPSVKTTIPLTFTKHTFMMMAEGGFWLKVRTRDSTIPIS